MEHGWCGSGAALPCLTQCNGCSNGFLFGAGENELVQSHFLAPARFAGLSFYLLSPQRIPCLVKSVFHERLDGRDG